MSVWNDIADTPLEAEDLRVRSEPDHNPDARRRVRQRN